MRRLASRLLPALIGSRPIARSLAALRRERAAVFMLHRFGQSDGAHLRHDLANLDQTLRSLRGAGVRFVELDTLIDARIAGEELPGPLVAFTVDDCYADLQELALPVFRRHACPVTGFVVPEVADGTSWFWWDQVDWLLERRPAGQLRLDAEDLRLNEEWNSDVERRAARHRIVERMKAVRSEHIPTVVAEIARRLAVPLPDAPPAEYRALDWDALRALEREGVRFGAHSLTHPVLGRCDDARVVREIEGAAARIRTELAHPSSVFAYPVGRAQDFGSREMRLVRESGFTGALSAIPGILPLRLDDDFTADGRWSIPRFAYDERAGAALRLALL